jgi:urease accessory protein
MHELGLHAQVVERPFEPEPGGYSGGGHHHHEHEHDGHEHDHHHH